MQISAAGNLINAIVYGYDNAWVERVVVHADPYIESGLDGLIGVCGDG